MKLFFRYFFKTIRILLGPFMLLWELLSTPKGIVRDQDAQHKTDEATSQMTLYEFKTCPFCIKVRRETKRLSLNIEKRDVQYNQDNRQQLLNNGGQIKVPCLQTVDGHGKEVWMYESTEIVSYLRDNFAAA
ncbi:Glutaredoxin [hydrothermal vent metagenome]|uniref:Glutaredoxin n=1 Tax=hydrothermal vent metagenome TaxID=652676 RepID=A0A3B0Z4S4_9ZZZZ